MREQRQIQALTSTTFAGDANVDFNVPKWAVGAMFIISVSAMAGTAETFDFKLQHKLPHGTFKDVLGASIVQLTAAADILLTIDPRITAAANITVSQALSTAMRAVITLGGSTDETYTYGVSVEFYS